MNDAAFVRRLVAVGDGRLVAGFLVAGFLVAGFWVARLLVGVGVLVGVRRAALRSCDGCVAGRERVASGAADGVRAFFLGGAVLSRGGVVVGVVAAEGDGSLEPAASTGGAGLLSVEAFHTTTPAARHTATAPETTATSGTRALVRRGGSARREPPPAAGKPRPPGWGPEDGG